MLHLRPGVREGFTEWLAATYPDLVDRYRELYPRAYAPPSARRELGRRVDSMVRSLGGATSPANPPLPRWSRPDADPRVPPRPTQLTL
jgi:hypothetical protein